MTISLRSGSPVITTTPLGDDTSHSVANVSVGDGILVGVYGYHASATITNVSISGESAFTSGVFTRGGPDGNVFMQYWWLPTTVGSGSLSVRVQLTAPIGGAGEFFIAAMTGHDAADFLEDHDVVSTTGANPVLTLQTATSGAAIFAMLANTTGNATNGSGYSDIPFSNLAYNNDGEYKMDTGGAGDKTVDFSVASSTYIIKAIAINMSGGVAGGALLPVPTILQNYRNMGMTR